MQRRRGRIPAAPSYDHEAVLARLTRILDPYVERHGLGLVFRARALFRVGKQVELEPDLMVRQPHPGPTRSDYWIIDPETQSIDAIRPDQGDIVATDTLTWAPAGANELLTIEVAKLFD